MKVKLFYPNRNGKIEFSPHELEKLLNEVYREGQRDCDCAKPWPWSVPYCSTKDLNIPTATYATYANSIADFKEKIANSVGPFVVAMEAGDINFNKAAETLTSRANDTNETNDVFSGLAKELNF